MLFKIHLSNKQARLTLSSWVWSVAKKGYSFKGFGGVHYFTSASYLLFSYLIAKLLFWWFAK